MISSTIWLKEVGYGAGGSELVFVAFVSCRAACTKPDETILGAVELEIGAVEEVPLGGEEFAR